MTDCLRLQAYYPKVLEDISPTHKFLTLQGWAYCLAGLLFMASPWAASMLLTFGQLATDTCPAETRNVTLLEPGEEVCGPKWGGSKTSDDVLEDKTEGASCMCPHEKYALQLASCLVSMVGYYYVQMARGNSLHFIATTCFNRLILVPVSSLSHRSKIFHKTFSTKLSAFRYCSIPC